MKYNNGENQLRHHGISGKWRNGVAASAKKRQWRGENKSK